MLVHAFQISSELLNLFDATNFLEIRYDAYAFCVNFRLLVYNVRWSELDYEINNRALFLFTVTKNKCQIQITNALLFIQNGCVTFVSLVKLDPIFAWAPSIDPPYVTTNQIEMFLCLLPGARSIPLLQQSSLDETLWNGYW